MRPIVLAVALTAAAAVPARADWAPLGNPLSNMPAHQSGPVMARGTWGPGLESPAIPGMFVVWTDLRNDAGDLYGAIVTSDPPPDPAPGTDGLPLVVGAGNSIEPAVAWVNSIIVFSQGSGNAFVVAWSHGQAESPEFQIRAQRAGDLDWGSTGVPVHDAGAMSGRWPSVTRVSNGHGAIVAWTEAADGLRALRVQRLDEWGARHWGANGQPLGTDTTVSDRPQVAAGPVGSAYVLRSDRRNGTLTFETRVLALFLVWANGAPAPGWPAEGLILGGPGVTRYLLLPDGSGGAYVAWEQAVALSDASPSTEVRATRVLEDGSVAPGWSVGGAPVVTRPDGRVRLGQADLDASGGLVLTLSYDQVVGGPAASGRDLLVQRLLPDGQRPGGWPAPGLPLSTAPGSQEQVQVIGQPDGLLAVWRDGRSGSIDLFGVRLLLDGLPAPGWAADGVLLCDAPSEQDAPVLAPAFGGGAVFAWADERDFPTNQTDMYAQTVSPLGDVGVHLDVPHGVPAALSLSVPRPQPASGRVRATLTGPAGEADVRVLDTQGRAVADWRLTASGGATLVEWDLADRSGRRVAPGIYHLLVRLAGESLARRVVVID